MKLNLPGKIGLVLLLYLAAATGLTSQAADTVPTRLQIGINLLPAVIAANNGLATIDASKKIQIYLLYRDNSHQVELLRQSLGRIGKIRKHHIDIQVIKLEDMLELDPEPFSTLFIGEALDARLPDLIRFSQEQRALLFSPFKGDVKRGVATGFRVTNRVLPLINMESLKLSKIQLKAFFLRIAVKHE